MSSVVRSLQAIIRAVCAIIDAFHFATEIIEEEGAEAAPAEEVAPDSAVQLSLDAEHVKDIQKALAKRVLPALQKQLVPSVSLISWNQIHNPLLGRPWCLGEGVMCFHVHRYALWSAHNLLSKVFWRQQPSAGGIRLLGVAFKGAGSVQVANKKISCGFFPCY